MSIKFTRPGSNAVSALFIVGLACLVWGAVTIYIEQQVEIVSAALSVLGIVSLFLCVIYKQRDYQRPWQLAQSRKSGIIAGLILLALASLIGINYFTYSLSYRWDVTQAGQHTLAPETIEVIQTLTQPVDLTALYVGLPPKYLQDLFNEYERISNGNIKLEIIDPIEKISYAAQFGNVIDGNEHKVIVQSGSERKDIDFSQSSLTEEQLSNAILRVTRKPRNVYFLTGHGEYSIDNEENQGLSQFAQRLSNNNVASHNLMLGVEARVPEDCDVLIIAGPRQQLTEQEQTLINDYLNRGGDALFLIENVVITTPDKPLTVEEEGNNPSLNSILNQWGVNIGTDIVVDLKSHVGGDVGSPATRNYMKHKAITAGLDYTFYLRPRSISVLEQRRPTIKLAPIVLTSSKEASWAETNRTLNIDFDEASDTMGPVPISFVIWEVKQNDNPSDTRIIVFTDADFLSNVYINQYSNAEMGLNIVNWLSELDYTVLVNQQELTVERLDLTSKQRRMVTAILFLIPLLVAAGGILVWIRR